jgi:hypothetical protein
MTDEELIIKYLNAYYLVAIGQNQYQEAEFVIGEIGKQTTHSKASINTEVTIVFKGVAGLAENFERWFLISLGSLAKNFDQFLNECELILGARDWVVIHKTYGRINPSNLTEYYNGDIKAHISTLKYLYDKWYDGKVFEVSEKMMKGF